MSSSGGVFDRRGEGPYRRLDDGVISESREIHVRDEEGVAAAVCRAVQERARFRTAGSGGSKSDITSQRDCLLHLDQPTDAIEVQGNLVSAPANMTNGRLQSLLAPHGLAIPTVGEWQNATLAGAMLTGTHGGSARYGSMPTSLREMRLVNGLGELVTVDSGHPHFKHSGVSLGLMGVITRVTFECIERFSLKLETDVVPFADYVRDPVVHESRSEFHASVWAPEAGRVVRFAADRTAAPLPPVSREQRFGWRTAVATFLSRRLGLHAAVSSAVFRRTAVGDISDILSPLDLSPQTVRFRVVANKILRRAVEFAVDAARASEALTRFDALFRAYPGRLLNPIGLRLTAGDEFTLSPSLGRDTLWMDVFYYGGEPFVTELATLAEELGARCHWGKTLVLSPEVIQGQYPEWEGFRSARARWDPNEVFANAFTDRLGLTGGGTGGAPR
ncbi:MAG: D-arabinono-1,4-lactone oxidase [Gemmatimonadota bacterium]|nr:MAG: D-arabinono-1,4-lactone oxidase [Gemmatimonadota bacterium]